MYKLEKLQYLARVLRANPSELLRLGRMGLTTLWFRYVKRCTGAGTIVGPGTTIVNSANVRIGRGCLLQDFVYIRAGTEGKVAIGDRAALNSFCRIFGHGGVEIGDDTQIGPGALLTTTDHDYEGDLQTRYKKIVIGRNVWVGANVTIVPGVEVGDGVVIGAGSVVTKDIPPNSIAVGVPARVIREIDRSRATPDAEQQVGAAAVDGRGRGIIDSPSALT